MPCAIRSIWRARRIASVMRAIGSPSIMPLPALPAPVPEVMIGPVAAATANLRVGSGGIMLPHYSPLKVAETFGMLSGLFPGRIDLGLGRAPGSSAGVARALQRDRRLPAPDDFPDQLTELLGYFEPSSGPASPPPRFASPEVWLLGSSPQSAVWAAERGLPYAFADFINPDGAPFAASYRLNFRPSARLQQPKVAVCAWAICAETEEEALRLSLSARMMMLLLFRGVLIPVPPVEKAEEFLAKEGVAPQIAAPPPPHHRGRSATGSRRAGIRRRRVRRGRSFRREYSLRSRRPRSQLRTPRLYSALNVTEWIHPCRPPRGYPAGDRRHGRQQRDDAEIGDRIKSRNAEQQRDDGLGRGRRSSQSDQRYRAR